MYRKALAVFIGLFAVLALQAQSYTVKVKLEDGTNSDPVGYATVSLTPEKGSVKYALSNHDGEAVLEKVKAGSYTLKAEILGYQTLEKKISIKADTDLGKLAMSPDNQVLDAAKISATGNPIIIKKDTVEYNASSYKISDDNVLEDLLKKLPGVEVAEDGSITANGETITKITIDGKTFFLDDPQLASKNIPAKLVEKVKVVKKKSEQAEFTGIDDGNEETIIDLSVKKGMMNGMFGNAMAGAGHDLPSVKGVDGDWRWQAAAMGGRFSEKSQISVILNANNTNNRGFNDLSGSMMRSMMGGGGMGRGGGQGMRRGSNGITTSWMGGLNANFDLFDNKMALGGNYLYNGSNTMVEESTYKETYLESGPDIIYRTGKYRLKDPAADYNRSFADGHRFGLELDHKFSENTSILFRPQFNFGRGRYEQFSSYETANRDADGVETPVNEGFTFANGFNSNWQASGFLLLRQRLGIPGRTISVSSRYNLSNNDLSGYNQTQTIAGGNTDQVNQFIKRDSKGRSINGRLVYTEPLGGDFYFEGSYNINYGYNFSDKRSYDSGPNPEANGTRLGFDDKDSTFNATYSNRILNHSLTQNIGAAFMFQRDKIRAQLGASALPVRTYNETSGYQPYDEFHWNFSPRAMLFYEFNDNSNARLFYWGRSSQPSTSQLLPVMDNSNPLAMSLGNPNLKPYFNHGLRSDVELSNKKSFFTMRLRLEGNYTQDPIVSALWYDDNSVTYSIPVNGRDSFDGNIRLTVNAPIAKSNFSIFNMFRASYSEAASYVGGRRDMTEFFYDGSDGTHEAGTFNYAHFGEVYPDLDNSDFFTVNLTRSLSMTERFRITYRSDDLEIMAGVRTRFNKPWYTIQQAVDATWANQANASFKWTVGDTGLEFGSDLDYNWYYGYTTDQPSELVWNASASMLVFKKMGTISLKAYDLLDQAKNLTVNDTSNYHQEVMNNTLGRYIMLSFTLRFGNFSKAGQQMKSRMGGPGGMGGGMGGGRRPF
ncbi:MAG: outer membrane beta-barrel protein [Bacteroidales bacterium]|nr:outer membrane beta-barrel protein [Bacteroidales bacterium]